MKYCIYAIMAAILVSGCATTKKILEVDTPKGYTCKTHGEHPKSYKIGGKYYCTICVDGNLGKVELVARDI